MNIIQKLASRLTGGTVSTRTVQPLETKASGTAVPDTWLSEILGGGVIASVTASEALQVPAVQAAIRVISEAVASCDVVVKRRVDGKSVDVPDHPVSVLLSGQVNPWLSGYEFIRDIVVESLTNDSGGFGWVNRVNGETREIIHYDAGSIGVQYSPKGTGEPTYRLNGRKINSGDVIHLRRWSNRCPLSQARQAIAAARHLETHLASTFANGAKPGGVIQLEKDLAPEQVAKIREAWTRTYGGPQNAGKPGVLFDGATWKEATLKSTDSQFLENRIFQNLEICRAFGLPPSMAYELERATWSNAEQAGREFITYTLMPWTKALQSALNRALLTDDERGEYRIEFDIDDTSQADLTARATAISTLITARVLNSNEAREWLGMEKRAGGDEYANPAIEPSRSDGNPTTLAASPANNSPKNEATVDSRIQWRANPARN